MESLSYDVLLLLMGTAAVAGVVDAIAGGGGLIVLPMLLWAGVAPIQALATNKLQGVFGTLTSSYRFVRSDTVDLRSLRTAILATFVGASMGAVSVQFMGSDRLARIVPAMLIGVAVYLLAFPRVGAVRARSRMSHAAFGWALGTGIGFYDGFFGPGTGSFFALAFVLLLGYDLRRATGGTKVLNFASNLASLLFFALSGKVVWAIGLPMAAAQVAGAWLGAHLVLRHGAPLVRALLVLMSLLLSVRLLASAWG